MWLCEREKFLQNEQNGLQENGEGSGTFFLSCFLFLGSVPWGHFKVNLPHGGGPFGILKGIEPEEQYLGRASKTESYYSPGKNEIKTSYVDPSQGQNECLIRTTFKKCEWK